MELGEEPHVEPGRDHQGKVGIYICVHLRQGWGCGWGHDFSQQSPQGAVPAVSSEEQSSKRRRIPRPRLAGPVLLNLSSMILPFSRGGAVGPGPGAPALSSPTRLPTPGPLKL